MKRAIQFGAGNIGRGFLAQLFTQSGYEVVFVDINKDIIAALNRKKEYSLKIVGDNPREILVKNVRAVDARDAEAVAGEFTGADIAATAVGVSALEKIAPVIASGICERAVKKIQSPLNIIICENLLEAGKIFREQVKKNIEPGYIEYFGKNTGFVETVVSRMIPIVPEEVARKDPLFVMAEEYCILPVARNGFMGRIPEIRGMVPYENLEAYEEQKLFIHNLGHAVTAYLGYLKGYAYIWEAISDPETRESVRKALDESGEALNKKHKFSKEQQQAHIDDLLNRFANKKLGDTVYRVGRDVLRKLGPNDRLIGAANLAMKYGIIPENISTGIAAALLYNYKEDAQAVELRKRLEKQGIDSVLSEVSKINGNSKLTELIKTQYEKLKKQKADH